jgi:dynein heavy chain
LDSIADSFSNTINKETAERLIDEMLAVINSQYYYSGRKAILDYVLKDNEEKKRVGIVKVLKPLEEWGCSTRKCIRLTAESVKLTAHAREEMSENLFLLPECILKITKEWRKYEKVLFFGLNRKRSQPVNLLYFVKKQQEKIAEVRNNLRSEWVKNIANYIR